MLIEVKLVYAFFVLIFKIHVEAGDFIIFCNTQLGSFPAPGKDLKVLIKFLKCFVSLSKNLYSF